MCMVKFARTGTFLLLMTARTKSEAVIRGDKTLKIKKNGDTVSLDRVKTAYMEVPLPDDGVPRPDARRRTCHQAKCGAK